MKLVDTQRSGRCARKGMGVRVPPSAYLIHYSPQVSFLSVTHLFIDCWCCWKSIVVSRISCQFSCQARSGGPRGEAAPENRPALVSSRRHTSSLHQRLSRTRCRLLAGVTDPCQALIYRWSQRRCAAPALNIGEDSHIEGRDRHRQSRRSCQSMRTRTASAVCRSERASPIRSACLSECCSRS